jgi:hypothetical protein
MSQIKISQLPLISAINSNTSNTLFAGVDVVSGITGQITAHVLAQGLFSNEILNVGTNPVTLPNTVAQFSAAGDSYIQTNLVNTNGGGTADIVITANNGTDSTYFIDLGFANPGFQPGSEFNNLGTAINPSDGYLYVQGGAINAPGGPGGNLTIGTTTANTEVRFIGGGHDYANVVAKVTGDGFKMVNGHPIFFTDGTTQNTAASSVAYSQAAYAQANTNANNITINGAFANGAFAKANTAVQNTAVVQLQALTLTGNLIANSIGQGIFVDSFSSNSATFSKNLTVLGNLTSNTLLGNVFFSNVTVGTSQANTIQWFPQYTSPVQTSGQVWYSVNTISLVQDTDVANDRPAISKVLFERVYNGTGSTIPAASWVRLAGAVTQNSCPYIQLADATSAANSQVEGFIKVAIANGSYGFIYTRGVVSDFDMSAYGLNGQLLFLSTTPGLASNIAPTGTNSVVQVAKILSNGSSNGKIQVTIANQQAYGKANGSVLFANNNLIQASNTAIIDEANATFYVPNGILYNQRSYVGAQTAITLSFATDTWVRANIAANMAVTLGNFRAGSDIVLFITNTASGGGSNKTITHGCSALNSTVGATTFTLSGQTTARIKYYCFDGDLANVYASISYS